jgi:hypothetical protein
MQQQCRRHTGKHRREFCRIQPAIGKLQRHGRRACQRSKTVKHHLALLFEHRDSGLDLINRRLLLLHFRNGGITHFQARIHRCKHLTQRFFGFARDPQTVVERQVFHVIGGHIGNHISLHVVALVSCAQ